MQRLTKPDLTEDTVMITLRTSDDRGHANFGWLNSRHTFSFGQYYDPRHMGFGALRVINEDKVTPGRGFGTHPHHTMEIISYVLDGALEHRDSMGTGSVIRPGEVQLMSAGTGVTHSEYNASKTDPVHFLQIWVMPAERGTKPRYAQEHFPAEERRGKLRTLVSPDGRDGSLVIGQDATLYGTLLGEGERVEHTLAPKRKAWVHVARGQVRVNGHDLKAGDGAALDAEETAVVLEGIRGDDRGPEAEVLVFDLV